MGKKSSRLRDFLVLEPEQLPLVRYLVKLSVPVIINGLSLNGLAEIITGTDDKRQNQCRLDFMDFR